MEAQTTVDAVVIGAGASGLAAAQRLRAAGASVIVLEARDRIGGRCFGCMGAGYVDGCHRRVRRYVQELGLQLKPQYRQGLSVLEALPSRRHVFVGTNIPSGMSLRTSLALARVLTSLEVSIDRVVGKLEDPWATCTEEAKRLDRFSLQDYFDLRTKDEEAQAILTAAVKPIFGKTPEEIGLLWFFYYCKSNRSLSRLMAVENGSQEFKIANGSFQVLCDRLALDLDIRLGQVVAAVRRCPAPVRTAHKTDSSLGEGQGDAETTRPPTAAADDAQSVGLDEPSVSLAESSDATRASTNWPSAGLQSADSTAGQVSPRQTVEIELRDGQVLRARTVVLALQPHLYDTIAFDPPLPQAKRKMAQTFKYSRSRYVKLRVLYASPWWRKQGLSGELLSGTGPVVYFLDDCTDDEAALIGFVVADHLAEEWCRLDSRQSRLEAVRQQLFAMTRNAAALEPTGFQEKDWTREVFSSSCVPSFPKNSFEAWEGLRLPCWDETLLFAGAETATHGVGYVEGALQAGERAAHEALRSLGVQLGSFSVEEPRAHSESANLPGFFEKLFFGRVLQAGHLEARGGFQT